MSIETPDQLTIESWSTKYLAKALDKRIEKIRVDIDVDKLGLDSTASVAYIMSLEEWLGVELAPELLFTFPTISKLASHLATLVAERT